MPSAAVGTLHVGSVKIYSCSVLIVFRKMLEIRFDLIPRTPNSTQIMRGLSTIFVYQTHLMDDRDRGSLIPLLRITTYLARQNLYPMSQVRILGPRVLT
jgi:hypothetical protein